MYLQDIVLLYNHVVFIIFPTSASFYPIWR